LTTFSYTFRAVAAPHSIAASFTPSAGNALRMISGNVVSISLTPPTGGSGWTCVEQLPEGLAVSGITGDNPVWDATNHRITWTSAHSKAKSRLSYLLNGPSGTYTLNQGTYKFGSGASQAVAGDTALVFTQYHPADQNQDFKISDAEMNAYVIGWQEGLNPETYAMRATYLFGKGGSYKFDAAKNRPACWLSTSKAAGAPDAAAGAAPERRIVGGVETTITFTPPDGAYCWAYAEYLPAGLTPVDIAGPNAVWAPLEQKITWYAYDVAGGEVALTYSVVGAAGTYDTAGCGPSSVCYDGESVQNTTGDATWTIAAEQFVISSVAGDHGSITPSGDIQVDSGKSQGFVIAADPSYLISAVLVDNQPVGAVGSYTFTAVDANHSVAAYFEPIPGSHLVTFAAGEGGALVGVTEQRVLNGGDCSPVTAVADAGHYFNDWTGTDSFRDTDKALAVTDVTADMELTANFETEPVYHVAPGSVFEVVSPVLLTKVPLVASSSGARAKVLTNHSSFKWGLTTFRCQWTSRKDMPGKYPLLVNDEPLTSFFYVEQPVLKSLEPASGSGAEGTEVTALGKFFGSKKPAVSMSLGDKAAKCKQGKPYYPNAKRQEHRSVMDVDTGASRLDFTVPRKLGAGEASTVTIEFKSAAPVTAPFNQ